MRTQLSNEHYLNFAGESSLKIVNDYRDKYGILSMILDENPDDPDALNYLGVFECQLRRFDQAEELINRSPALRPAAQSLRASGRGENALSGIFHNAGMEGESLVQRLAQTPGQVLDVLPGDAAGTRAAGHRPFVGLAGEVEGRVVEAEVLDVAFDDGEVGFLVAVVETDPQPEAIRERHLFFHRLGRVNGGRALIVDHLAGH